MRYFILMVFFLTFFVFVQSETPVIPAEELKKLLKVLNEDVNKRSSARLENSQLSNKKVPTRFESDSEVIMDKTEVRFFVPIRIMDPLYQPAAFKPSKTLTWKDIRGEYGEKVKSLKQFPMFGQIYELSGEGPATYHSIQGAFEGTKEFFDRLYEEIFRKRGSSILMKLGEDGRLTKFYAYYSYFIARFKNGYILYYESEYGRWYPNDYTRLLLNTACRNAEKHGFLDCTNGKTVQPKRQ